MTQVVQKRFPFQIPLSDVERIVRDFHKVHEEGVFIMVSWPDSPPPYGENLFPNPRQGRPWVYVSIQAPAEHWEQVQTLMDAVAGEFAKR